MAEIGTIAKARRNDQQGFNFRGIDQALSVCGPVFAKLGLTPDIDCELLSHDVTVHNGKRLTCSMVKL